MASGSRWGVDSSSGSAVVGGRVTRAAAEAAVAGGLADGAGEDTGGAAETGVGEEAGADTGAAATVGVGACPCTAC